ncbi:hypothetical protein [Priestia megaterium]|uniref:hypothetical protein n=1 Tax=Priestia megaterium TaxID=1404 RepID=UPI002E1C440A|nr:hypothetical protein [Priestia megaterium]
MRTKLLQKKINFIDLYIFLMNIEIQGLDSHLHDVSLTLLDDIKKDGFAHWRGKVYTEEDLLHTLQEEEGTLTDYSIHHTSGGPEAVLKCSSGNGFTIYLKDEDQIVKLYQYLLDYVAGDPLPRKSLSSWEREFLDVVEKNDRSFGRMMQIISSRWEMKDPDGALTVGPCASFVKNYGSYHKVLDDNHIMKKALEDIDKFKPSIQEDYLTQIYDLKQIAIDAIHPF